MRLRDKTVLVLGLGDTGFSAARYLARQGARVRVADSRNDPPHAAALKAELPRVSLVGGAFHESLLDGAELIVASPGVPLREPLLIEARARGMEVVGDIELFARDLRARYPQGGPMVLAITGANGKSTVTSMVGAMCKAAGLKTAIAGNIGLPVLDALAEEDERPQLYVLELSSFQLETTFTLNAAAATVLNVTEDHLDRYPGMAEYAAAKARIFQGGGVQVLNREDQYSMAMALPGRRVATFGLDAPQGAENWGLRERGGEMWFAQGAELLMRVNDLPLTGLHNAANALAALALCRSLELPLPPLLQALREFKGLPHRVERVAEIEGVSFYDDSKGTNVGATVAALNGMPQQVVLIAGGDGKGQDFSPLRNAVAAHARAVVLIGRDGRKIGDAIRDCGVPLSYAGSMEQAVAEGFSRARAGDAVMLSPACASFDMFRNYEHRAEVFRNAVEQLKREAVH